MNTWNIEQLSLIVTYVIHFVPFNMQIIPCEIYVTKNY